MVGSSSIPRWLRHLLGEKYFDPCNVHKSAKKNEKNIFCLHCCVSICPHCLPLHHPHRHLQIRRYVYHDVIRLTDAQKFINCSLVQPYTTNSSKVVFLNERPISRSIRGSSGNFCINCDRSLHDPFIFCSLSCKVHHMVGAKMDMKELHNHPSELLPFFYKTGAEKYEELEEIGQVCVSARTLSGPTSAIVSNGGGVLGGGDNTLTGCNTLASTAKAHEFVKRRRSSLGMPRVLCHQVQRKCPSAAESVGRRKGVPHRSPLN